MNTKVFNSGIYLIWYERSNNLYKFINNCSHLTTDCVKTEIVALVKTNSAYYTLDHGNYTERVTSQEYKTEIHDLAIIYPFGKNVKE